MRIDQSVDGESEPITAEEAAAASKRLARLHRLRLMKLTLGALAPDQERDMLGLETLLRHPNIPSDAQCRRMVKQLDQLAPKETGRPYVNFLNYADLSIQLNFSLPENARLYLMYLWYTYVRNEKIGE